MTSAKSIDFVERATGTSMHTSLTTPDEIKSWLKAYKLPYQVSDEIKIENGQGYIFDRLAGEPLANGHWNFVYCKGDEVIVYDSFGVPFFVPEFKNKKVIYSLEQDQKLNEKSCGLYCFLFAFKLYHNILELKNYLVVDFKNKSYYVKNNNIDKRKLNKYLNIYEEIHKH